MSISKSTPAVKYLSKEEASKIDEELGSKYKITIIQLLELAGFSCALAFGDFYPKKKVEKSKILVCCGVTHNGGIGLVTARHLKLYGYTVDIYHPKKSDKEIFSALVDQCEAMEIPFIGKLPTVNDIDINYPYIVDALFGYSFVPPIDEAFNPICDALCKVKSSICSIDIPCGWDVEKGPMEDKAIKPDLLISLNAPKMCSNMFKGKSHLVVGRYLPVELQNRFNFNIPPYNPTSVYYKLK